MNMSELEGRGSIRTKFMISPRFNLDHDCQCRDPGAGEALLNLPLKKECERLGVKIYDTRNGYQPSNWKKESRQPGNWRY